MPNTSATNPPTRVIRAPEVDLDFAQLYADSLFWLQHHWVRIGVAASVAVVVVIALRAMRGFGVRMCNRDRPGDVGWWRVAGRTLSRTGNFFIVTTGIELASGIAGPPGPVAAVIKTLFTIAAVFQGALWARELIIGAVEHHSGPDRSNGEALSSAINIIRIIVTFAVFAIALVVVLDNVGVNVTGLIAGLGVGGIAIGLAAQGIFADLFAALAIILDRPFRVGDVISFDQTTGTVEEIGLKSTRVRPPTGEEHIIANKQLLEKEIRNITRRQHRRNKFVLGIIYQTPPALIARIPDMLREEVEACGQKFAQAGFAAFNASSIDIELEYDTPSPAFDPWYQARHVVGLAILRRFAAEGIEFAYPTQTSFTAAPDGKLVLPYALPNSPTPI
ncbi:MAG: mechanosensitive ion channel family protein [Sphingomonas sp.]|nr:mechanosensitive ion channel family protein [Sphingomonas sp.]